ncbi:tryptophan 7-halogenase [Aurantiacibacter sp. D1-12]|uniref:tryptophan 7-halogenase n=1 Tax=Aurantiacibacter sp. D1-12 TaxID=2993658 RepID=UPI00237C9A57|nr:tryptophan 7-halogenase [Aurantiacibacter sp. D1-12]MDE1467361.1 tryptophan 7-halogenase [Aurantiacibacter sp. D1-12]
MARLRSITVMGDPLMARVVAAMLSQALDHHQCRVTLGDLGDTHADGTRCLVGPASADAFTNIGLPQDKLLEAGGSVHFSWKLRGKEIMSGAFGAPMGGVDFHHHLHRVEGELTYEKMVPFNPGAIIEKSWPAEQVVKRKPARFGMMVARGTLQQLLLGKNEYGAGGEADFIFDVRGDGAAEWHGNVISAPASASFPELGLYRCVRAVERFLALLPGAEEGSSAQSEFNHLSLLEDERITDFAALLVGQTDRPALQRKIEAFSACGDIPLEEYELFPPGQWICALLQSGFAPRDYNHMADRIPIAETRQWLDGLLAQLDQLARSGAD